MTEPGMSLVSARSGQCRWLVQSSPLCRTPPLCSSYTMTMNRFRVRVTVVPGSLYEVGLPKGSTGTYRHVCPVASDRSNVMHVTVRVRSITDGSWVNLPSVCGEMTVDPTVGRVPMLYEPPGSRSAPFDGTSAW